MSRPALVLLWVFRSWQALRAGRPSPCRYQPTCSAYGVDAVRQHGAVRGLALTLRRIGRCRPGGGSGWDPVPDARSRPSLPASTRKAT